MRRGQLYISLDQTPLKFCPPDLGSLLQNFAAKLDFTPWLEYFTAGIADELARVEKELEKRCPTAQLPWMKAHHQLILKTLVQKGSLTDSVYATLVKRAKATRVLDFQKLIQASLIERKAKGPATYYVLKE